jgi:hypothetical protein
MNFIKDDVLYLEGCGGKKAATAMNGGAKNERRSEVQVLLWSAEGDNSESLCAVACALRPVAVSVVQMIAILY